MATVPLITTIDFTNRYDLLIKRSGVTTAGLADIVMGNIELVARYLGFNPELDDVTGLPTITENLNGGRPVINLLYPPDLTSPGASITVLELGVALTRRTGFPTPPLTTNGDYVVGEEGYTLYRLNGSGSRGLGVWGANSTNTIPSGTFGNTVVGGARLEGDYTDRYREAIRVTYNPAVKLSLLKSVALQLCRLDLIDTIAATSVTVGDRTYSYSGLVSGNLASDKECLIAQLPTPILIGTGN